MNMELTVAADGRGACRIAERLGRLAALVNYDTSSAY